MPADVLDLNQGQPTTWGPVSQGSWGPAGLPPERTHGQGSSAQAGFWGANVQQLPDVSLCQLWADLIWCMSPPVASAGISPCARAVALDRKLTAGAH